MTTTDTDNNTLTIPAELVDWQVGERAVEDTPDRHWPVALGRDWRGNINLVATRPDGTKLETVLEVADGHLALRVYATDANGVDMTEGGAPLHNIWILPDNKVELIEE